MYIYFAVLSLVSRLTAVDLSWTISSHPPPFHPIPYGRKVYFQATKEKPKSTGLHHVVLFPAPCRFDHQVSVCLSRNRKCPLWLKWGTPLKRNVYIRSRRTVCIRWNTGLGKKKKKKEREKRNISLSMLRQELQFRSRSIEHSDHTAIGSRCISIDPPPSRSGKRLGRKQQRVVTLASTRFHSEPSSEQIRQLLTKGVLSRWGRHEPRRRRSVGQ